MLRVPFVDMLSTMTRPELPLTAHEYGEWGDAAADPAALAAVRKPLHTDAAIAPAIGTLGAQHQFDKHIPSGKGHGGLPESSLLPSRSRATSFRAKPFMPLSTALCMSMRTLTLCIRWQGPLPCRTICSLQPPISIVCHLGRWPMCVPTTTCLPRRRSRRLS